MNDHCKRYVRLVMFTGLGGSFSAIVATICTVALSAMIAALTGAGWSAESVASAASLTSAIFFVGGGLVAFAMMVDGDV